MRLATLYSTAPLLLAAAVGCGGGPPRADAPDWSPSAMAEAAVSQLDASGDAAIDRAEAASAPGLLDAFDTLDADANDSLSAAEIEERFRL